MIQPSFKNGAVNLFTGWTLSGTGSNGSAIVDELSDILFVSTTSARVMKIIGGSPVHVADLQAQGTATASYSANALVRFSMYYKDLRPSAAPGGRCSAASPRSGGVRATARGRPARLGIK